MAALQLQNIHKPERPFLGAVSLQQEKFIMKIAHEHRTGSRQYPQPEDQDKAEAVS